MSGEEINDEQMGDDDDFGVPIDLEVVEEPAALRSFLSISQNLKR